MSVSLEKTREPQEQFNPPEVIDWAMLSPVQRYQKSREIIQGIDPNFEPKSKGKKREESLCPYSLDKDGVPPEALGAGGTLATGGILQTASHLLSETKKLGTPRGASVVPDGVQGSLRLAGTALSVGLGIYFTATSYRSFANELRTKIWDTFQSIENEEKTLDNLSDEIEQTSKMLEGSYFKWIFSLCNPRPMGYMHLTKGICLDSEKKYADAQAAYEEALGSHFLDAETKDLIHYAYGRSLRLENKNDEARTRLENISETSIYYRLRQLEEEVMNDSEENVFEFGVPRDFCCIFTEELMIEPVNLPGENEVPHYYEKEEIEAWIEDKKTHPVTGKAVTVADLQEVDRSFAASIEKWQQTRLKE